MENLSLSLLILLYKLDGKRPSKQSVSEQTLVTFIALF